MPRSSSAALVWAVVAAALGGCGDSLFLSVSTDGILEVRIQTGEPGQDGWRVRVDGGVEHALPSGGMVRLTSLRTGAHLVELLGGPPACRVVGTNPRRVLVNDDAPTAVAFDVQCGMRAAASAASASRRPA